MLVMSTRNIFQKWFILIFNSSLVAYVRDLLLFCLLSVKVSDLEVFVYFDIVATLFSNLGSF